MALIAVVPELSELTKVQPSLLEARLPEVRLPEAACLKPNCRKAFCPLSHD